MRNVRAGDFRDTYMSVCCLPEVGRDMTGKEEGWEETDSYKVLLLHSRYLKRHGVLNATSIPILIRSIRCTR